MHSYFLPLLFGSVLVAVVVMVCLVSLVCNRQSSETALTFVEGVINVEILILGLNYRRLGKKLLLIQPRSQQEGDRGDEVASYWCYVLMHVHSKVIRALRLLKEVTPPTFGLQNSSLEWFFNQLSVVKPKLKLSLSPIAKDTDNPMKSINQSKHIVNTCS